MTQNPLELTVDPTIQALATLSPLPSSVSGAQPDEVIVPAAAPSADAAEAAIAAMAALTGKPIAEVRTAYEAQPGSEAQRKLYADLQAAFPQNSDGELDQKAFAKKLQALTDEQRAAITKFMQDSGYLPKTDVPVEGKSAEEQSEEISRSVARHAAANDMAPEDMLFAAFFRLLMQALGLGDVADELLGVMGIGGGGGGSYGTRSASGEARFSSEPEINAIVDGIGNKGSLNAVVDLANALAGQHETGNNGGAIVRAVMGYEGDPWCGGTVRFVFEKAGVTGLYDQGDYTSAKSYMREGKEHGAFRSKGSGYVPQPGDVVVFDRGGDKGHVGIVTSVENGTVTYVAGNDGDAVSVRSYSLNSPPAKLIGVTDTHALASAKGITLGTPVMADAAAKEGSTVTGGVDVDAPSRPVAPVATPTTGHEKWS